MAKENSDDRVDAFTEFRTRMNARILAEPNQVVRRFFALDTQTYRPGALDRKTKELLGLVASLVLRCDDCLAYHVAQCQEAGVERDEMFEAFSVRPRRGWQHRHPAPAVCGGFPGPDGAGRVRAARGACPHLMFA